MKDEYIKELQAIVRLLVFSLSFNDNDLPVDCLYDIAYGKEHLGLSEFVRRFLNPGENVSGLKIANFNSRYITGNDTFPVEEVKSLIRKMPYKDFLETTYWRAIAYHVKIRDGKKCTKCGSKNDLHVHHLTYENHGDELHHMDDLVTLCKTCHEGTHNEDRIHKDLPFD